MQIHLLFFASSSSVGGGEGCALYSCLLLKDFILWTPYAVAENEDVGQVTKVMGNLGKK